MRTCVGRRAFLKKFPPLDQTGRPFMSSSWMTILIVAVCALVAGFLAFGGANMGY